MLGICLLVSAASAQMSGTYTINPNGGGARNFKSFDAATYQLFFQGVSGPTVMEIAAGTYRDRWNLVTVPGVSSKNTLTFKSVVKGAVKRDVAGGGILNVSGFTSQPASWIVFDGLEFSAIGGSSSALRAVYMQGEDIEIRNCEFYSCYIECWGPRYRIHHSLWHGTKRAYLAVKGTEGGEIHHNEFRFPLSEQGGLSVGVGLSQDRTRVYNNLLWGVCSMSQGFYVGPGVDFVHNTVVLMKSPSGPRTTQSVLDVYPSFATGPLVSNNILVNMNGGRLLSMKDSPYSAFYATIHNNVYWTTQSTVLFYLPNPSTNFVTLAQWQSVTKHDAGSMFVDPRFENIVTLPLNLKLKAGSPAIDKASATPSYVTDDFEGKPRRTPATIGAYEGLANSSFLAFGSGCGGTGGHIPSIGYTGTLQMGSTNFAVTLGTALGGTSVQTWFVVGASKAKLNFGGVCDLLVSPDLVILTGVSGTGPGNGSASIRINLPNDPKLRGADAHMQWGVIDPSAAGGIAFSNAATLTL